MWKKCSDGLIFESNSFIIKLYKDPFLLEEMGDERYKGILENRLTKRISVTDGFISLRQAQVALLSEAKKQLKAFYKFELIKLKGTYS